MSKGHERIGLLSGLAVLLLVFFAAPVTAAVLAAGILPVWAAAVIGCGVTMALGLVIAALGGAL